MFLYNVSKIFGHGLLSFALGVVRFCFSMGTVAGFVGIVVFGFQWLVFHEARSAGYIAVSLGMAFGCFVANVAIATLQGKLREALQRSLSGGQPVMDNPAPAAPLASYGALPASIRAANDEPMQGKPTWR